MDEPLDKEERLLQALIDKNNEIEELKSIIKKGFTPDTLKDHASQRFIWLWALVEGLGKKYIKCPRCNGETKPVAASNGFFLMVCTDCGVFLDTKKKKVFSAYK